MTVLSEDDLARLASALGLPLARERIPIILPEVQRIMDAASRLRELPLDAASPPGPPAPPGGP